jgi:hypothetical protein
LIHPFYDIRWKNIDTFWQIIPESSHEYSILRYETGRYGPRQRVAATSVW